MPRPPWVPGSSWWVRSRPDADRVHRVIILEMGAPLWNSDDLSDAMRDPGCFERWSPVTGEPILRIDLDTACDSSVAEDVLARLSLLPAVSVGVGGRDSLLARCVDIRLAEEPELDIVAAAIEANPLASVALVQLLRRSEGMLVEQAILAESAVYSMLQGGPEFARWLAGRKRREVAVPSGAAVRIERDGDTVRMHLNRPEKRNAFSAELRDGLCEALQFVLRDETVARVEWSGEGPAFCSGGDLDEFGTLPDPTTANAIRATRSAGILLAAVADRVHARVHGACIGAGVELPALCGRVSAHPDAFFALPEVGMGLVPGAGGTASLPRRIGRQRTAWLAISGERIDAATALAWGLVDEVDPVEVATR